MKKAWRSGVWVACALGLVVSAARITAATSENGLAPLQPEPLLQTDNMEVRDINEIARDFRSPTTQEIKALGSFWYEGPEEENAAHWFTLAAGRLHAENPPAGSLQGQEAYAGDLAAFEKWVEGNRVALDTLRKGLELETCCAPVVVFAPTRTLTHDLDYFGGIRKLARVLCDAGLLHELKGRPDLAAEAYLDCIRLGRVVRSCPTLIEDMVAVAVMQMGAAHLESLVAQGHLDEETLRMIIAECRQAEAGQKMLLVLWERDVAFSRTQMAIRGDVPEEREQWETMQRYSAAVEAVLAKRTLDEMLQKKVIEEVYRNELREFADKGWRDGVFQIGGWGMMNGRMNVYLRVTEMRAGIALYQRTHAGALPETLDALCPDTLSAVPIDPFSGKPMHYVKTGNAWRLWSVGEDNLDNGGTGDTQHHKRWEGPDAVFVSSIPTTLEARSTRGSSPAAGRAVTEGSK